MKIFIIFAVALISCLTAANGLRCHVCAHGEDLPGSDSKCKKKPDHLAPCIGTTNQMLDLVNQTNPMAAIIKELQPTPGSKAIGDALCVKYTAKFEGNDYVIRGCTVALSNADWNQRCDDLTEYEGIKINFKACYCNNKDGCNGAGSLTASAFAFTLIGLLTFLLK